MVKLYTKNKYKFCIVFLCVFFGSCNKDGDYQEIPQSPVVLNLDQVPYNSLSEYHFFEGNISNLSPSYGVLPYAPASSLFTDYTDKLRFIWLPSNSKMNYVNDGSIFDFPTGAVLIKNFYYNNSAPDHQKRIIETRVLIKKQTGWIYANYVWNNSQSDAYLQNTSSTVPVSFYKTSGELISTNYKIPSQTECTYCHKINTNDQPIGVKPQNLNFSYSYNDGYINQLEKLISFGYLENNLPQNITSVVDYSDISKPIDLRVRSYFDANCAHCHIDGGYASVFSLRLAYNESDSGVNLGICKNASHFVPGYSGKIIIPGDAQGSILYFKMNTNDPNYQMPFLGRTMIHTEGVQLIEQWINSLLPCN